MENKHGYLAYKISQLYDENDLAVKHLFEEVVKSLNESKSLKDTKFDIELDKDAINLFSKLNLLGYTIYFGKSNLFRKFIIQKSFSVQNVTAKGHSVSEFLNALITKTKSGPQLESYKKMEFTFTVWLKNEQSNSSNSSTTAHHNVDFSGAKPSAERFRSEGFETPKLQQIQRQREQSLLMFKKMQNKEQVSQPIPTEKTPEKQSEDEIAKRVETMVISTPPEPSETQTMFPSDEQIYSVNVKEAIQKRRVRKMKQLVNPNVPRTSKQRPADEKARLLYSQAKIFESCKRAFDEIINSDALAEVISTKNENTFSLFDGFKKDFMFPDSESKTKLEENEEMIKTSRAFPMLYYKFNQELLDLPKNFFVKGYDEFSSEWEVRVKPVAFDLDYETDNLIVVKTTGIVENDIQILANMKIVNNGLKGIEVGTTVVKKFDLWNTYLSKHVTSEYLSNLSAPQKMIFQQNIKQIQEVKIRKALMSS